MSHQSAKKKKILTGLLHMSTFKQKINEATLLFCNKQVKLVVKHMTVNVSIYLSTYGSRTSGEILSIISRKPSSPHQMFGFCG